MVSFCINYLKIYKPKVLKEIPKKARDLENDEKAFVSRIGRKQDSARQSSKKADNPKKVDLSISRGKIGDTRILKRKNY